MQKIVLTLLSIFLSSLFAVDADTPQDPINFERKATINTTDNFQIDVSITVQRFCLPVMKDMRVVRIMSVRNTAFKKKTSYSQNIKGNIGLYKFDFLFNENQEECRRNDSSQNKGDLLDRKSVV